MSLTLRRVVDTDDDHDIDDEEDDHDIDGERTDDDSQKGTTHLSAH